MRMTTIRTAAKMSKAPPTPTPTPIPMFLSRLSSVDSAPGETDAMVVALVVDTGGVVSVLVEPGVSVGGSVGGSVVSGTSVVSGASVVGGIVVGGRVVTTRLDREQSISSLIVRPKEHTL